MLITPLLDTLLIYLTYLSISLSVCLSVYRSVRSKQARQPGELGCKGSYSKRYEDRQGPMSSCTVLLVIRIGHAYRLGN
ncbi:hypothetical protein F4810DRAFT_693970 [Camillea tinctor]|nr:hypothetical protein F4810DRAFT_693970 [Camillea tinctor]